MFNVDRHYELHIVSFVWFSGLLSVFYGGQAVDNWYEVSHTVEAGQSVTLACCNVSYVHAPATPYRISFFTYAPTTTIDYLSGVIDATTNHTISERHRFSDDWSSVIIDNFLVTDGTYYDCIYYSDDSGTSDYYRHHVQVYSK